MFLRKTKFPRKRLVADNVKGVFSECSSRCSDLEIQEAQQTLNLPRF
ncbi:hypothetical protein GCWU000325_01835 [Alloprevotella tannerae ATCC 51259]|uniref:Uncharacterized protein n=1 Tax=Alloprevotella tannerae ATCC 51259 TaxID=626522 RepID=C9LHY1_9BACT|nr:hypothetical protein GCWU000325_01835 [Alloprevotella tannerae ATCC 51259]